MFLSSIIFLLLLSFVATNLYVEIINEGPTWNWQQHMISDYLYGVRHWQVQCYGFFGLSIAELLLIFAHPGGKLWSGSLVVAAVGLWGVVLTGIARKKFLHRWWFILHDIMTGFAFVGALVAEAVYLWNTPAIWLPVMAVASTVLFTRFAPKPRALEEKTFTAFLVCGLLAIAGLPF